MPEHHRHDDKTHGERITAIEGNVATVERDLSSVSRSLESVSENQVKMVNRIAGIESSLGTLADSVTRMTDRVESVINEVGRSGRADWKLVLSALMAVVAIVGAIGGLAFMPLRESVVELKKDIREHQGADAHDTAIADLRALKDDYHEHKEALKDQDIHLQREMRDLIAGLEGEHAAKIDGLDKVLQREMRMLNATLKLQSDHTEARVKRIESWTEEHDRNVSGLNAEQSERLRALERAVFEDKGP